MSDLVPFFKAWVANPKRISAISPSGSGLAKLITSEIDINKTPVLELGPGTGVFTRALLDRGLAETDLTLIESADHFANLLGHRYPHTRLVRMDACKIGKAGLFEKGELGCAVSGLPLLSMSPRQILGILNGVFGYLREDGALYQFTYGPRCPVPSAILKRLSLRATRIGTIMRNVPPSSVYRIERQIISSVSKQNKKQLQTIGSRHAYTFAGIPGLRRYGDA